VVARGQKYCCVTAKATVRNGSPKARLRNAAMGLDGSRRHLGECRQPREAAGCLEGIRLCPTVCLGCQRMSSGTLVCFGDQALMSPTSLTQVDGFGSGVTMRSRLGNREPWRKGGLM